MSVKADFNSDTSKLVIKGHLGEFPVPEYIRRTLDSEARPLTWFARHCGLHQKTVARIVREEFKTYRTSTLNKILKGIEVIKLSKVPPQITTPPQSRALKTDIKNGQLVRDRNVDSSGNNPDLIHALQPSVREAINNALTELNSGNKAFGQLGDNVNAYLEAINHSPNNIDFGQLFARASALRNALNRAKERDRDPKDVDLSAEAENAVETILDLHEPIMGASGLGDSIMQASISWNMTPEQHSQYKADVDDILQEIKNNPNLVHMDDMQDFVSALSIPKDTNDLKLVTMAQRTAGNIAKVIVNKPLYHCVGAGLIASNPISAVLGGLIITKGFYDGLKSDAGKELISDFDHANDQLLGFLSKKYDTFLRITKRVDGTHWLSRIIRTRASVDRVTEPHPMFSDKELSDEVLRLDILRKYIFNSRSSKVYELIDCESFERHSTAKQEIFKSNQDVSDFMNRRGYRLVSARSGRLFYTRLNPENIKKKEHQIEHRILSDLAAYNWSPPEHTKKNWIQDVPLPVQFEVKFLFQSMRQLREFLQKNHKT